MLVQHLASLTRDNQSSAASSYQTGSRFQGIKRPAYTPPARLRRRDALVQRIASLTRDNQSSAASSYQTGSRFQGIKRPAYTPPAFDGLYFLRLYPSYIRLSVDFDGL